MSENLLYIKMKTHLYYLFFICLFLSVIPACLNIENNRINREDSRFETRPFVNHKDSVIFKGKEKYAAFQKVITYGKEGKIKTQYTLKAGLKHGIFTKYFTNGVVEERGNYQNGLKEGQWLVFHYTEKNKQTVKHKEINYVHDKKEGEYTEWHRNGYKLKAVLYKNDKEHGRGVSWFWSGEIQSDMYFENGLPHGKNIVYYPGGQKRTEGFFEKGKKNGLMKEWFENGQRWKETHYEDNIKQGPFKIWDQNGKLIAQGNYVDGRPIQ